MVLKECFECKKCINSDDIDDVMIMDSNDINEKISSHKSKWDSSWGMLI